MLLRLADPLDAAISVTDLAPIQTLSDSAEIISTEVGKLATIQKRSEAPRQLLLVGHYDTVFSATHEFQNPSWSSDKILQGPGVADMKGGILVMLAALSVLESAPEADQVGWTIIFNPDEELGSLSSADSLAAAAASHHLGMVFEPSFPDGNLAGQRKGSGTYRFVARGVAAHAGRDHHLGRNAVAALSRLTADLDALNGTWPETTINVGYFHGGGPTNIVPDLAVLKLNVRIPDAATADAVAATLKSLALSYSVDGISIEVDGFFSRPPKILTPQIEDLLNYAREIGSTLGLDISSKATGGVSDGNNLAAAGLPNLDNLGVHGGAIHSGNEHVYVESMSERAKLSAAMMLSFARGDLDRALRL